MGERSPCGRRSEVAAPATALSLACCSRSSESLVADELPGRPDERGNGRGGGRGSVTPGGRSDRWFGVGNVNERHTGTRVQARCGCGGEGHSAASGNSLEKL